MTTAEEKNVRQYLSELSRGYRPAVILLAAHQLGLFEALGEAERTTAEVAEKLGASRRGVDILLNALVALELLEKKNGRFAIRPAARPYLLSGSPSYYGGMLRHNFNLLQRWLQLPQVVRSGEPVRPQEEPARQRQHRDFIAAMADIGSRSAEALAQVIDLSDVHHLLDLGGGPAVFAMTLCRHFPHLQATVFDTPETIEVAQQRLAGSDLQERIHTRAGDFFTDPLGGPFDAVLLSSIVHIYSPEQNRQLIARAAAALQPGGRLLIRDFLVSDDHTQPLSAALFAVNMLVNTENGNCYSGAEIESWLREAGLGEIEVVELENDSAVVQGWKST